MRELAPEEKEELAAELGELLRKGIESRYAEIPAEEREQRKRKWSKYTIILSSAAGICVLLMLTVMSVGREIYRSEIPVSEAFQAIPPGLLSIGGLSQMLPPGFIMDKEVYFQKAGIPHRIAMKGTVKLNTWCDVELSVLDDSKQYLFSLEDCFWNDKGRDEEGSWHKSDTKSSLIFIPKKTGKHYFHVSASGAKIRLAEATPPYLTSLEISVFQGVILLRYFLISAIIFSIAACYTGIRAYLRR